MRYFTFYLLSFLSSTIKNKIYKGKKKKITTNERDPTKQDNSK